jgi:hypothetical protein
MLVASLGDIRSQLVSELNAERDGFAGFVGTTRSNLINFIVKCASNLNDAATSALDAVGHRAEEDTAALDAFMAAQANLLAENLYKLAKYHYSPHAYAHSQEYQPYSQYVVKDLFAQIEVFGDAILAAYDAATQAAMGAAEATNASEQAAKAADNQNL